ncbi:MAG: Ig-like domain-containing protein, partial [Muribaculaceae bacterium]|nr:Ig-like domain-containing protein [Muribaculaceae bacterium]
ARLLDQNGNELQRYETDTLRNGIYVFKYVNPGTYTVEVSSPLHFTQTKTVTVTANAPTYQNFFLKRVRDTPPEVVEYSPVWNEGDPAVKCSTPIVLSFNWDMDDVTTCNAFHLDPPVEGTFEWEDSYYRLVFTPTDAFDVNTLYTLTLDKSAEHGGGTPMEEDFVMQFYTQPRNHLTELAVFPYENAPVNYKTPTVELRVDSMLDTYNLFQRMRVLDSEGNEVPWNKRSIKYNKVGDDYGFVRIPLVRDIEAGKDYHLILDVDIADTAGIHLPAARDILFHGVYAGADKPGMTVVEDFESTDGYSAGSNAVTASSERLFGNKSLQVSYDLEYSWDGYSTLITAPGYLESLTHRFAKGDTLGIHVWGDMSYNDLYAVLWADDEACEVTLPLGKIDYHGWRYVSVPVRNLPEGDFKFAGFRLDGGEKPMCSSGIIRFDNLLRAESSGIDEVPLAGLKVWSDGDYIVASADTYIQGMELLDMNGRTIKAVGGNCINVASMSRGIYLVRVHINGSTSTQKVKL